jgi:hypothetical protein
MFWIGLLAERLRVQNGIGLCSICGWKYGKGRLGQKKYEEEKNWENW